MMKKAILAIALLIGYANADFWKEGDGWVYNDHGDHKALTHVLSSLSYAKRVVDAYYQSQEARLNRDGVCQVMKAVNGIGYELGRWIGHTMSLQDIFIQVMKAKGIGEADAWKGACWKRTGSYTGAIDREISHIMRANRDRGIYLVYRWGFWEVDLR